MFYRKKPVVIEAAQWFKNGDHPQDYARSEVGIENGQPMTFTGDERGHYVSVSAGQGGGFFAVHNNGSIRGNHG